MQNILLQSRFAPDEPQLLVPCRPTRGPSPLKCLRVEGGICGARSSWTRRPYVEAILRNVENRKSRLRPASTDDKETYRSQTFSGTPHFSLRLPASLVILAIREDNLWLTWQIDIRRTSRASIMSITSASTAICAARPLPIISSETTTAVIPSFTSSPRAPRRKPVAKRPKKAARSKRLATTESKRRRFRLEHVKLFQTAESSWAQGKFLPAPRSAA